MVTRRFQRTLEAAGLPRVAFHDIRHGAASMLLEAGADIATVSRILGHSNIAITADTYGHLTQRHMRDTMERLTRVVG